LRVQKLMKEHRNGYVGGFDISSFFMSINKDSVWSLFSRYEEIYKPSDVTDNERMFILSLVKMMIMHNPALLCDRKSPDYLWDLIPDSKSLFHMQGLPIGNFYSQLLANLFLAYVCEKMRGYNTTEFVDDFCIITDSVKEMHEAEIVFRRSLEDLGLKQSRHKVYIQPVRHGIKWCGYVVRPDRIYVSNRPISNCKQKILSHISAGADIRKAKELMCVINSYIGMMCHCQEYNNQRLICSMVMNSEFRRYLLFKKRRGMLVCSLKNRYKGKNVSMFDITNLDNYDYTNPKELSTL